MPNWVEGDLRVKATKKDVLNFLRMGVAADYPKVNDDGDLRVLLSPPIEKYEEYIGLSKLVYSKNAYLRGTTRFFIGKNNWKPFIFDCLDISDLESDDLVVINLPFHAAWTYRDKELSEICKKYRVSMAVYGVESGMQFVMQSTISDKGDVFESLFKQFKDDLEFRFSIPFSNLGG